jgi:hypothetical protein
MGSHGYPRPFPTVRSVSATIYSYLFTTGRSMSTDPRCLRIHRPVTNQLYRHHHPNIQSVVSNDAVVVAFKGFGDTHKPSYSPEQPIPSRQSSGDTYPPSAPCSPGIPSSSRSNSLSPAASMSTVTPPNHDDHNAKAVSWLEYDTDLFGQHILSKILFNTTEIAFPNYILMLVPLLVSQPR